MTSPSYGTGTGTGTSWRHTGGHPDNTGGTP